MGLYGGGNEVFERVGGEFMAGYFSLGGPVGPIGVEDAVAEEVVEDGVEAGAFDEVGEVGAEDVLEVSWVGSAYVVREGEKAVHLEGEGWGGGKHVGRPVVEAVAVAEESDEVSDYWV